MNCVAILLGLILSLVNTTSYSQQSQLNIAFTLKESPAIIEGMTYDPVSRHFLFGESTQKRILKYTIDGRQAGFIDGAKDGMTSILGMSVFPKTHHLWVCGAIADKGKKTMCLFEYDLSDGKLVRKYPDTSGKAKLFNDVTITTSGSVFATDTYTRSLYTADASTGIATLYMQGDSLRDANGITSNGNEIFVSTSRGFTKINTLNKNVTRINLEDYLIIGNDGLYYHDNSLIGIQNVFYPLTVGRYHLDNNHQKIKKAEVLVAGHPMLVIPTTGAPVGDDFYFMSNNNIGTEDSTSPNKVNMSKIRPVTLVRIPLAADSMVMQTVSGSIRTTEAGIMLPHEHVLVDFIGADSIRPGRYNPDSVFSKALPFLKALKEKNCRTLVECTPNYLGRDVNLLQRLSKETGLNIITNTGYYGAVNHKYLPRHVYTESAEQIAKRWINEYENGIDGTGIKPGFLKLSADKGPLSPLQRKVITAGALAHKRTGLPIAIHSGDGKAALEEFAILRENDVPASSFIWVHAQNEKNYDVFRQIASQGAWVEFDGLNEDNVKEYVQLLKFMKQHNLLKRTLVSHDAGFYNVGEKDGGSFRSYTTLYTHLLPLLRKEGFSDAEVDMLTRTNPAAAFSIRLL